jgi:hypothetical protein
MYPVLVTYTHRVYSLFTNALKYNASLKSEGAGGIWVLTSLIASAAAAHCPAPCTGRGRLTALSCESRDVAMAWTVTCRYGNGLTAVSCMTHWFAAATDSNV